MPCRGIRTRESRSINSVGRNKRFGLKFQLTEEGRIVQQPKRKYANEDDDSSSNNVSNLFFIFIFFN